jgi:hypothetical protein
LKSSRKRLGRSGKENEKMLDNVEKKKRERRRWSKGVGEKEN